MKPSELIALANEAADAAFESHMDEIMDMPPAEMAYEFIRNMKWEAFDGSETAATDLWMSMELSPGEVATFRELYDAEIALLTAVDALEFA